MFRCTKTLKAFILSISLLAILMTPYSIQAQPALNIIIDYVEANPIPEQETYTIKAYFSLLDPSNEPITDLTSDDFTVTEDYQPVSAISAHLVEGQLTSLVLAIDTSGSMLNGPIEQARKSSINFIDRLGENDQVAVFTFNDTVTPVSGFTSDHKFIKDKINQITAVYNTGTCLYDAMYQAVQLAATQPPGHRAVLVLTDGKDEGHGGGPCSTYKKDDVIGFVKDPNARVPIYIMGVGSSVDKVDLTDVATHTGGLYLHAADISGLDDMFGSLQNRLNSEYVLEYTSNNAPGDHTLVISAKYKDQTYQQAHSFNLPVMPTSLKINSPAEKSEVYGIVTISVLGSAKGEQIARMSFTANDKEIGKVLSAPFDFNWDTSKVLPGGYKIGAVAYNKDGKELARTSQDIMVVPTPTETPTIIAVVENTTSSPTPEATVTPIPTPAPTPQNPYLIGGIGLLALIIIGGIIFFIAKKRKAPKQPAEKFEPKPTPIIPSVPEEGTKEDFFLPATLVVEKTKDPGMKNQTYYITKSQTRIGASPICDMVFGQGIGISRNHVIIETIGGNFLLREGRNPRGERPAFGTYVNDVKVEPENEPVHLVDGSLIRLGNLTEIRVHLSNTSSSESTDGTSEFLAQTGSTSEVARDPEDLS